VAKNKARSVRCLLGKEITVHFTDGGSIARGILYECMSPRLFWLRLFDSKEIILISHEDIKSRDIERGEISVRASKSADFAQASPLPFLPGQL
jgi:hypothetical protein